MIVISGALVLVALILLIVGVVGPDLTFVYASIGVSLVSLVFLVIGILQRRGDSGTEADTPAAPEVAEQPADSVTTVLPSQVGTSRRVTERVPVAATADEEPAAGRVLVVEGRPRYHVQGCRYLSGKQADEVDVLDAREEGFSPCGVCKPDEALAERVGSEELAEEDVVEEDVPGVEVPAPTRTAPRAVRASAKKAAASKTPAKVAAVAPAVVPAKAPAKVAAKTPAKAPAKVAAKVPAKAPAKVAAAAPARKVATKAPSRAATAAAAATPAAAAAANKPGSVVVIPDRGKFHRAECRYVRDVPEAEVLTKSAATRQGYAACGVCRP